MHHAHHIKGSSSIIGADQFASSCEDLETAARQEAWQNIIQKYEHFTQEYERLMNYLNEEINVKPVND